MSAFEKSSRFIGALWLALILFTVVYWPAGLVLRGQDHDPSLGSRFGWLMAAVALYVAVLGVLALITWLTSGGRATGAEPTFGLFVPSFLARRTGLAGTDALGLLLGIAAAVLSFKSLLLFPWIVVVTAVFGLTLLALKVEPWPVVPGRTIPVPAPLPPLGPDEETVERTWTWSCRCRPMASTVSLRVRTKLVAARSAANPSRKGLTLSQWQSVVHELVETGAQDREVAEAAHQLLAFARNNRFNYFEEAQNTLQFAQVIPYVNDHQTKGMEYFRFAIETLYDDGGDCDCKAILAATLFRLMGLRSVVLLSAEEGHAAVAVEGAPDFPGSHYYVWNAHNYYFCETTDGSFGFTVGEVPPNVELSKYTVQVEIEPALMAGG